MDKFFKISERGSTIRTEVIAGISVFLSIAYIMAVNPIILSDAGMDPGPVFVATIIGATIGTLISGLYANYPVAQAPGMGLNAFFAYTFVLTLGFSWQEALFAVFLAGILFLIMSIGGLREIIINAIPSTLKSSITVGIGGFIGIIGLKNAGIITGSDATLVTLGDLSSPTAILAIIGVVVILILMALRVKLAIFFGMVVVAVLSVVSGQITAPETFIGSVPNISEVFGAAFKIDFGATLSNPLFYFGLLAFLIVNFFDTAGTLISVGGAAGMIDEDGKLVGGNRALISDAASTVLGAVVGTSPVTTYLESLVGVELGGRTGLVSVVVSIGFMVSLFFSGPILAIATNAVTSPALIIVGALMFGAIAGVDLDNLSGKFSAYFTFMFMVLTYSIADGIGVGFIVYTLLEVAQGKGKKVHPVMYCVSLAFIIYFVVLSTAI